MAIIIIPMYLGIDKNPIVEIIIKNGTWANNLLALYVSGTNPKRTGNKKNEDKTKIW